jgi:AmmeMemoRadiSam system protein A
MLSPGEREDLLRLARAAIADALGHGGALERSRNATTHTPGLLELRGAFVSLKQPALDGGRRTLRGCVGRIEASAPLTETIALLAPKAALEDPRFSPVTAGELEALAIEISVLTVPAPVRDPGAIEPGRDGVQLSLGTARAVFLPQVALEQGWNRERLLANLARKAGLAEDGWRDAELGVFQAEVFGE